jgi:salicylate hydroxylase
MSRHALIVGGGIGGLASALALARQGMDVQLLERSSAFSEVGAGIQLGPNSVRILQAWGLGDALQACAATPSSLQVRSAESGALLGELELGARARRLYGAPYLTIHRADLHALLLQQVQAHSGVRLMLNQAFAGFTEAEEGISVQVEGGARLEGDLLVGADGVWSAVRAQLLNDGPAQATGHLAYRALVRQSNLPEALRSQQVTVWLGPRLHVVQYPVRGGDWLNVVALVEDPRPRHMDNWDQVAVASELRQVLAHACPPLVDLVQAIDHWRLWSLCIRPPMHGPHEQARGRVALLGDAAHPMLPYLAQGAGMAIEDAQALATSLANPAIEVQAGLAAYAQARWQRNARVQARALRNSTLFHARGPLRWGRDLAMKALGQRLLDIPWLYRGP